MLRVHILPYDGRRAILASLYGTRAAKVCGQKSEVLERKRMHMHLSYPSGQSFSTTFSNFTVKVTITKGASKRVHVSFRDKDNGKIYAAFSLPYKKARQLAHAMLTTSMGDVNPVEFFVEESAGTRTVAA
jgi:hypothetical protein